MTTTSELIRHESCPHCGSSDANAYYTDGHHFCFSCEAYTAGTEEENIIETNTEWLSGSFQALRKRGLTEETCRFWGYQVAEYNGSPVQVATFRDVSGRISGQKLRTPDKEFKWIGKAKDCGLYGQWLWRETGKNLVICEGEIDAMSLSQVQNHKWPTVSLKNGAGGAKRDIANSLNWVEKFDNVILMFDQDEAGQKAAREVAEMLSVGKAKIAKLPMKDPNEMLVAGKVSELIDGVFSAREYRPDGLVNIEDLVDEVNKPVEQGLPWFLDSLTEMTYGRRDCEVYAFGAGTGIGKTDFITQQIAYDVCELGQKVGVFFLEQQPTESAKRIAGKVFQKRFHVPDGSWTPEELVEGIEQLSGKVMFYNSFGQTDWDVIKNKMRYMAHAEGIRLFYVDHLTAMADTADEKASIEQIMKEMAGIANELKIIIHFVSHLATPDGKPHEEGGHVSIRHFKGSRSIGFWSYFMFGLERNQQDDDPIKRQTTRLRVLKDRYTGQATGNCIYLGYNHETTQLYETTNPEEAEENATPEDYF